jgi:hypothetical protein
MNEAPRNGLLSSMVYSHHKLKVLKTVLCNAQIPNIWLQWLQNVKKPLVGLSLHLDWPKIEENTLLGVFLQ